MADAGGDREEQHAAAIQRRYLLRFEADTLSGVSHFRCRLRDADSGL
jgi:hypothetical protein